MKCNNCGNEIDAQTNICPVCGSQVKSSSDSNIIVEMAKMSVEMNKLIYFKNKSKFLRIYCGIIIGILAIVIIASLIVGVPGVPILAGFLIFVNLILLLANNAKNNGKVKFVVGRPLVVVMGMLTLAVAIVPIFWMRTAHKYDDYLYGTGENDISGKYVYKYEEELDGEIMSFENIVILNEDNTCEITFQDTITGVWSETSVSLDNGSEFEYTIEGNDLSLKIDGNWTTFSKE